MKNGIFIYRLDFKSAINSFEYMFYIKNTLKNEAMSFFVKNEENESKLYSQDGFYVNSFVMNGNELLTRYTNEYEEDLIPYLQVTSCFDDCMTTSESNWMNDGISSSPIGEAYNSLTWNTVGQTVAAVFCGGCCQFSWWNCPTLAEVEQEYVIQQEYSNYSEINLLPIESGITVSVGEFEISKNKEIDTIIDTTNRHLYYFTKN